MSDQKNGNHDSDLKVGHATVMTLNPSKPLSCRPNKTVFEAAQAMLSANEHYMLVVDSREELLGIFTAKDLAFRVVSNNLEVQSTTVDKIMTSNPMCAKVNTRASDALDLMVAKHFRHLPIVNGENQIVGVLDITKCYKEAIKKLEKLYKDSKNLYDAMGTVSKNFGSNKFIITYFENMKKLLSGPVLEELLNEDSTLPIYVSGNSTIYDAAMHMKYKNTTALLVRDNHEEISGIITSKDIVSRVLSKGLDPNECLVKQVMTRDPSMASKSMSINDALKQMFEGKYLNLPVIDNETNEIVGVVDILRLTNFTLMQIQTMETLNDEDDGFDGIDAKDFDKFLSIGNDDDNDDGSYDEAIADISVDEIEQFNISSITYSTISSKPKRVHSLLSVGTVDYNQTCSFKFRVAGGNTHRISYKPCEGIAKFKKLITEELTAEELQNITGKNFEISYFDEDDDIILINNDKDLKDCVLLMSNLHRDKVELVLAAPKSKSQNVKSRKASSTGDNTVLLSAAMFTLAASIIVVFTLSRKK